MNEPSKTSSMRGRGLGKGLAALLGESLDHTSETSQAASTTQRTIPIEHLEPCPLQPRRYFVDKDLNELAESIRENGIIQPLLVRPIQNGRYEIVAGERRWRAAQRAGLHELPVVERTVGDQEALQLALVENLQREDLNPLEEAEAYQRLIADFHHRQEDVASALGKSRSHIANTIRLLNLPSSVRALIGDKSLTAGHARALLGASDPMTAARTVISKGLSVRQTEQMVRGGTFSSAKSRKPAEKDPNVQALEEELSRTLGLQVKIKQNGRSGTMSIAFKSIDQLDILLKKLSNSN